MQIRPVRRCTLDTPINISQIPQAVRQILNRLDQGGFESWLVGGCVRDLCLGLIPKDFDLATNARPEQVAQLFEHNYATGLQHGTVTIIWQDLAVEITTFRSEGAYSDSRRPDMVIFQDEVEADLARRDFTINSLAWRPDRGVLDLHNGLADLQQGLLRTVGDADARFAEDALRMLRAIRFAVTYDLTPDPDLIRAAAKQAGRLALLSRERISREMLTILGAAYPQRLSSFGGCGILSGIAAILLEIETDDRRLCENLSRLIHPGMTIERRLPLFLLAAAAPEMMPGDLRRVLLPLCRPSAGHAITRLLINNSRISRQLAQRGEAMLYLFRLRLLLPLDRAPNLSGQRRLLRLLARHSHLTNASLAETAGDTVCLLRTCLGPAPAANQESLFGFNPDGISDQPLTLAELALNGRQLLLAGWPPGPSMRLLLERLLSLAVHSPAINRPADLIAQAWTLVGAPKHFIVK